MRGAIILLIALTAAMAAINRPSFAPHNRLSSSPSFLPSPLTIRGGSSETEFTAVADMKIPYSPNLVTAKVREHRKSKATSCKADSTVTLSEAKAKELGVKSGDAVAVIGRRRRQIVAYISVSSKPTSKSSATITENFAANLCLRDGDAFKVVPSPKGGAVEAMGVIFAPTDESLAALEAADGGDEIPEDDLQER